MADGDAAARPAPAAVPVTMSVPVPLCASSALAERGDAFVFEVLQWRQKATAFVMRFDGRLVAYLNRCVHVPTELDWQEGKFLDGDREFIVCSIHGATYDPNNGRCVGGPCARGSLTALRVDEREGQVYWYPSSDTRPARAAPPVAPPAP
jgi:nitrite reductase/ring-hydroxylating ferredoxin subunit